MSSELEQLLREHARQLDAEMAPIAAHEVIGRVDVTTRPSPAEMRRSRPWGIGLSVAAALAMVAGAGILVARLDGGSRIVTPAATADPTTAVSTAAPTSNTPASAPTTAQTPAAETTAASTAPPEPKITSEVVQLAQREALRNLTGFSAVASFEYTGGTAVLGLPDEIRYTLLADGSLFIDTGDGTFGSFDPSTGIVLGVFRDDAGGVTAQEMTGQTDNGLPLTILGGFDPTRLIEIGPDGTRTISEVAVDGRPAWEVTVVEEFTADDFSSAPFDQDFTQTTIQLVDQESGLIVRSEEMSTDPNSGGDRTTTLSEITVVDSMPSEFPGTLPDGVEVDRSGSAPPVTGATVDDVADLFGVPVPVPSGLVAGTAVPGDPVEIVLVDRPQFDEADDPNGEPRTTFREARFTIREGFVATTVAVSAIALREGAEIPTGLGVSEGYLCFDGDGDGDCNSGGDPQGFTDGNGLVPIESGLFAELSAELNPPDTALISGSIYYGPFAVAVYQADRTTISTILGSFELVNAPT